LLIAYLLGGSDGSPAFRRRRLCVHRRRPVSRRAGFAVRA
jgi:hypothetical protein